MKNVFNKQIIEKEKIKTIPFGDCGETPSIIDHIYLKSSIPKEFGFYVINESSLVEHRLCIRNSLTRKNYSNLLMVDNLRYESIEIK